ncbi:MAG: hypothetical protein LBC20_10725 [Planctomycetaceae bacterium]|nr:hypothetical protein [Planctomycetaceae bacterium]
MSYVLEISRFAEANTYALSNHRFEQTPAYAVGCRSHSKLKIDLLTKPSRFSTQLQKYTTFITNSIFCRFNTLNESL